MSIKKVQGYLIYLTQVLGRGSFGSVYRGIIQATKEAVAVKIIPKDIVDGDEYLKSSLQSEIKILRTVVSQHIVGFYDVMESSRNYYIVQELCDCDLYRILKPGQLLSEQYCIEVLAQICEGLLTLVREGIIHRDLKPANILRRGNIFKIGDFGFSKQTKGKNAEQEPVKMKTTVGTPLYMSIEILKSLEYSSKCDIYALGVIFYEMLHGQTPWSAARQYELVHTIQTIPLKIKRKDLSADTVDFLQRCLQVYECNRISWNQLFVHPIFKGLFVDRADQNREFQNKMKSIMTKLRLYFHLNRQNLQNFLQRHGYRNRSEDLTPEQYFQFLKAVNPTISQSQATYIFTKTDTDQSGTISITQILSMLKNYGIEIEKLPKLINPIESIKLSAEQKLKSCFIKLKKIIVKNRLSLRRVFNDFDKKKKGYLSFQEFKHLVQKICQEITMEQAALAFEQIDTDHSEGLDFQEICRHYWFINGLKEGDHL